jgi:hypothetical protein
VVEEVSKLRGLKLAKKLWKAHEDVLNRSKMDGLKTVFMNGIAVVLVFV